MWSFPACPGSGMGRVRLDVIRFPVLPFPDASQACVRGARGAYDALSQKVGQQFQRANRLRRQNERATLHIRVNAKMQWNVSTLTLCTSRKKWGGISKLRAWPDADTKNGL